MPVCRECQSGAVVCMFGCLKSSNPSRDPGIRLSRDDVRSSTWHHGEGGVCMGDGLPVFWPHLSALLRLRWLHSGHNWVGETLLHDLHLADLHLADLHLADFYTFRHAFSVEHCRLLLFFNQQLQK